MKLHRFSLLALLCILLTVSCGSNPATPDNSTDPALPEFTATEFIADIPSDTSRTAQSELPMDQLREWFAFYYSDYLADMLANSKYGHDFMHCYLFNYAIIRDGNNWYFGFSDFFGPGGPINDYQIYAFVAYAESEGETPYYPVENPCP